MNESYERHPLNSDGPFYVVEGECVACGALECEADNLMSHDERGHCYFARQPETVEEVDAAIRATWASCTQAVRYSGDDPEIIERLARLGNYSNCDGKLVPEPSGTARSWVKFEEVAPEPGSSVRRRLKDLIQSLAKVLEGPHQRCERFRIWWSRGSFRVVWGLPAMRPSIRFAIKHETEQRWEIRIEDNALATTGWAIRLDDFLRGTMTYSDIRWYSPHEDPALCRGSAHPY